MGNTCHLDSMECSVVQHSVSMGTNEAYDRGETYIELKGMYVQICRYKGGEKLVVVLLYYSFGFYILLRDVQSSSSSSAAAAVEMVLSHRNKFSGSDLFIISTYFPPIFFACILASFL